MIKNRWTTVSLVAGCAVLCIVWTFLSDATAQVGAGADSPTPTHNHVADEEEDCVTHDEHEGHDHAEDEAEAHAHAENANHAEDGDEHHDHGTESVVRLSEQERRRFGIRTASAAPGRVINHTRLPGEIVLNADRVAHIVPRAPGIVRKVLVNVGDEVRSGDVMAWIESAELGEAKVDYLAKWSELGCCTMDLSRAQAVHDNTLTLLELLESLPSLQKLRDLNGNEMGENRSVLVSAYAELKIAEAAYLREKPLFEKKIASEREYLAAEAAFKKADAMYAATRDSVNFAVRRNLLEAKREQQLREIELKGARRRLFVMGLSVDEITDLQALAKPRTDEANRAPACDDPNCKNCKRHAAAGSADAQSDPHPAEEKLAWYPLRAPFDGTVIEKHLTLGERHGDDSGAFTVADLETVWVDIAIYQKDLAHVRKGMTVSIAAGSDTPEVQGAIAYVAPVVDRHTRTAMARVVLPNADGYLRPGRFVNARIAVGEGTGVIVVPKKAVQRMDGEPVVFVDTPDGFAAQPVVLGQADDTNVEIIAGLSHGRQFVTDGAFELKARIVTSGLDPHAGHGH